MGLPSRTRLLGPLERLDKIIQNSSPTVSSSRGERRRDCPFISAEARMKGSIVEEGVTAYERFTGKLAIEIAHAEQFALFQRLQEVASRFCRGTSDELHRRHCWGRVALGRGSGLIALLISWIPAVPCSSFRNRVGMSAKPFQVGQSFAPWRLADVRTSSGSVTIPSGLPALGNGCER